MVFQNKKEAKDYVLSIIEKKYDINRENFSDFVYEVSKNFTDGEEIYPVQIKTKTRTKTIYFGFGFWMVEGLITEKE